MNKTQEQDIRTQLKRAGKDLMPIIVIFGFAIVMTIVAVTLFSILQENRKQKNMASAFPDHRFAELLRQGEEYVHLKNFQESEKIYKSALKQIEEHSFTHPSLSMQAAELELRLASLARIQQDNARYREHLLSAEQHLSTASAILKETIHQEDGK